MEPEMASRKHELRQAISLCAKELDEMAPKTEAQGFKKEVFDALKDKLKSLKEQYDRVVEADNLVASLAEKIPGQERALGPPKAPASAHKLCSTIKNFRDQNIAGQFVSKADQAYVAGKWFQAALFNNAEALEWCKWNGVAIQKVEGVGINSTGGFLVPEELMANIIILREEYGVFR